MDQTRTVIRSILSERYVLKSIGTGWLTPEGLIRTSNDTPHAMKALQMLEPEFYRQLKAYISGGEVPTLEPPEEYGDDWENWGYDLAWDRGWIRLVQTVAVFDEMSPQALRMLRDYLWEKYQKGAESDTVFTIAVRKPSKKYGDAVPAELLYDYSVTPREILRYLDETY